MNGPSLFQHTPASHKCLPNPTILTIHKPRPAIYLHPKPGRRFRSTHRYLPRHLPSPRDTLPYKYKTAPASLALLGHSLYRAGSDGFCTRRRDRQRRPADDCPKTSTHHRPHLSGFVNAYQLAITISLLSLSSLGDILGYRRIYIAGLFLFSCTSLLCALSDSLPTLIISRTLQGFGAAAIASVNTALIRIIYPSRFLARGMGINALVVSVSAAAGPNRRCRHPVGSEPGPGFSQSISQSASRP